MRPIVLAALLASATVSTASAGDLLIHGGPIHTGVEAAPSAQAVLIRDSRILFVGDLTAARAKAAKDVRDFDLKGAAAFPGFVDAHAHLTGVGLRELTLNLDQVKSVALVRMAPHLTPGEAPRACICAFGSPEEDGFTPTMGCELAAFIARVVERMAERWPVLN